MSESKNNAKYSQISHNIRMKIQNGQYLPGDQLPTEAELTQQFDASRQTIRHALSVLEAEKLLCRKQGTGTFVCEPPVLEKRERTNSIGLICTYPNEYLFPSLISGIAEVVAEAGMTFRFSATQNRFDQERRVLLEYLQNSVDGLIIEGSKTALQNLNLDLYNELKLQGTPMVFINGYYPALSKCIYIVTDDYQGGYDAVSFLNDHGYKKIAGIFKSDDMQGQKRCAGFIGAKLDLNLSCSDDDVFWYRTPRQKTESLINPNSYLLHEIKAYDAVVCYNDELAIQLISLLAEHGLNIPGDLAVISFDNTTYAELGSVKLTSFSHPKKQMGIIAAQKLLNLIHGEEESPLVIPWQLVEREST